MKSGRYLLHDAFVNVEDFKSEVIVLSPCVNVAIMIQLERIGCPTCAIVNTKVNMRSLGVLARLLYLGKLVEHILGIRVERI